MATPSFYLPGARLWRGARRPAREGPAARSTSTRSLPGVPRAATGQGRAGWAITRWRRCGRPGPTFPGRRQPPAGNRPRPPRRLVTCARARHTDTGPPSEGRHSAQAPRRHRRQRHRGPPARPLARAAERRRARHLRRGRSLPAAGSPSTPTRRRRGQEHTRQHTRPVRLRPTHGLGRARHRALRHLRRPSRRMRSWRRPGPWAPAPRCELRLGPPTRSSQPSGRYFGRIPRHATGW